MVIGEVGEVIGCAGDIVEMLIEHLFRVLIVDGPNHLSRSCCCSSYSRCWEVLKVVGMIVGECAGGIVVWLADNVVGVVISIGSLMVVSSSMLAGACKTVFTADVEDCYCCVGPCRHGCCG